VCYPLCSLRRSVNFFLRRSVNFYVLRPAAVRCGYIAVWAISARGVSAPVTNRLFLSCLPVVAHTSASHEDPTDPTAVYAAPSVLSICICRMQSQSQSLRHAKGDRAAKDVPGGSRCSYRPRHRTADLEKSPRGRASSTIHCSSLPTQSSRWGTGGLAKPSYAIRHPRSEV
jgi:hypothetical protein